MNKALDYTVLDPHDHIKVAAFNGNLDELKKGIERVQGKPGLSPALTYARHNTHLDCVSYLVETIERQHAEIAEANRQLGESVVRPDNPVLKSDQKKTWTKKMCPACGPVETRYSNCPRCWGPVTKRQ